MDVAGYWYRQLGKQTPGLRPAWDAADYRPATMPNGATGRHTAKWRDMVAADIGLPAKPLYHWLGRDAEALA